MARAMLQQGMPQLTTPFLNKDGTVNIVWYRFLQSLQIKSGLGPFLQAATQPLQGNRVGVIESDKRVITGVLYPGGINASVAYAEDATRYLNVYDVRTGQMVGRIQFTDVF